MKRLFGMTILAALFVALTWVVSLDTGDFVKAAILTAAACGVSGFLAFVVVPVLVWCFDGDRS